MKCFFMPVRLSDLRLVGFILTKRLTAEKETNRKRNEFIESMSQGSGCIFRVDLQLTTVTNVQVKGQIKTKQHLKSLFFLLTAQILTVDHEICRFGLCKNAIVLMRGFSFFFGFRSSSLAAPDEFIHCALVCTYRL